MSTQKARIWELDALRGICILGMVVVHIFFDLAFFGGMDLGLPAWFDFVQHYGHVFFVLISGICATLGSHSFRRGVFVFCAGLLVSYVTLFMDYVIGVSGIRIWFGILHMLGVCMMLYPLFKKLPFWLLGILGIGFIVLGFWLETVRVSVDFLFPLGLRSGNIFTGSDFFPIFPGLGWFLFGAGLGKLIYGKKQSLLPKTNANQPILRFFRFCGVQSLPIYLLHQPVIALIVVLSCG